MVKGQWGSLAQNQPLLVDSCPSLAAGRFPCRAVFPRLSCQGADVVLWLLPAARGEPCLCFALGISRWDQSWGSLAAKTQELARRGKFFEDKGVRFMQLFMGSQKKAIVATEPARGP